MSGVDVYSRGGRDRAQSHFECNFEHVLYEVD